MQKAFDAYNRQIALGEVWKEAKSTVPKSPSPSKAMPKIATDKKSTLKTKVFEKHVPKEPRDRATVGQKRIMEIQAPVFHSPGSVKSETTKERINIKLPNQGLQRVMTAKSSASNPKISEVLKEKAEADKINEGNSAGKTKILVRTTTLISNRPSTNQKTEIKMKN